MAFLPYRGIIIERAFEHGLFDYGQRLYPELSQRQADSESMARLKRRLENVRL